MNSLPFLVKHLRFPFRGLVPQRPFDSHFPFRFLNFVRRAYVQNFNHFRRQSLAGNGAGIRIGILRLASDISSGFPKSPLVTGVSNP